MVALFSYERRILLRKANASRRCRPREKSGHGCFQLSRVRSCMSEARGFNSLKEFCDCRLGNVRVERLSDLSSRQVVGGHCLLQLGNVDAKKTGLRRALWMSWFREDLQALQRGEYVERKGCISRRRV